MTQRLGIDRRRLLACAVVILVILATVVGFRLTRRTATEQLAAFDTPTSKPASDSSASLSGRWHQRAESSLTLEQQEEMDRLRALGYLAGTRPAGADGGVTTHQSERVEPGFNLYVSGHAPEAILMDMDGVVLHRWTYDLLAERPDYPVPLGTPGIDYWRRAHLFDNGDLLAMHVGVGLIKIDKNSRLLWDFPANIHHDIDVLEDGTIYTLTREPAIIPGFHPEKPVLEDFITVLNPDGGVLRQVSLLRAMEDSPIAEILEKGPGWGDILHTNTLQVLDGRFAHRTQAFARGNVLVSFLYMGVIAVVNLDRESVVWARSGPWRMQHEPMLLGDGAMLIFDNMGGGEGVSRVLEFDPISMQPDWSFTGGVDEPFYSASCGAVQRLANGNTLITESDAGRAIEVTRSNEIVWEFVSPHRAGDGGELVATLFDLTRIPADSPPGWIH